MKDLENEFTQVLGKYKRKWYIEKATNELLINTLLIALFGGFGVGLVAWRLLKK